MPDELTADGKAGMADYIAQLDAALEFHGGGVIPYDIVTKGIVVEENPNPAYKDAGARLKDMQLFGLVWVAEEQHFITPPYDEDDFFSAAVPCIVPWSVLVSESNTDWWHRVGEIQLITQMAEIPPGFKFTFYPDANDSDVLVFC